MTVPRVSLDQLRQVLVHLPERRFRHLVRAVVRIPRPEDVSVLGQLRLTLADWMSHLGDYLTDQAIVAVLRHYAAELAEYQAFLLIALERGQAVPGLTLTVSDGRWVHTTPSRSQKWFDLDGECEVEELPGPCATHIVCDVPATYLRVLGRLSKLGGITDATPGQHRDAAAAEPRQG